MAVSGRVGRSRWVIPLVALPLIAWSCSPGDLDLRFGRAGKVTTEFLSASEARAIVRQPDGKIVAVGATDGPASQDFALARYNRNGSLDRTFGIGGKVTTDLTPAFDHANAVALQPDGKIVVAGSASHGGIAFGLARYNRDGTLDRAFGTGGIVIGGFAAAFDGANALTLQPDGKIILAGSRALDRGRDFALVRYNTDGTVDSGFGTGGLATSSFGGGEIDSAQAVVVQRSGRIVAGGTGSLQGFAFAGFTVDGKPDPGFGTDGQVITTIAGGSAIAYAMALRWDDSFVVVGSTRDPATRQEVVALARYGAGGALDATFGTGGVVTTSFGEPVEGRALALGRHGEIVVAASTPFSSVFDDFVLARYQSDGKLDRRFGKEGLVTTDFFGGTDHARAVIVQPDESIVVGGLASAQNGAATFGLARYHGTRWRWPHGRANP